MQFKSHLYPRINLKHIHHFQVFSVSFKKKGKCKIPNIFKIQAIFLRHSCCHINSQPLCQLWVNRSAPWPGLQRVSRGFEPWASGQWVPGQGRGGRAWGQGEQLCCCGTGEEGGREAGGTGREQLPEGFIAQPGSGACPEAQSLTQHPALFKHHVFVFTAGWSGW